MLTASYGHVLLHKIAFFLSKPTEISDIIPHRMLCGMISCHLECFLGNPTP